MLIEKLLKEYGNEFFKTRIMAFIEYRLEVIRQTKILMNKLLK